MRHLLVSSYNSFAAVGLIAGGHELQGALCQTILHSLTSMKGSSKGEVTVFRNQSIKALVVHTDTLVMDMSRWPT